MSTVPTLKLKQQNCCICNSKQGEIIGGGPDFEYSTCANEFSVRRCVCGHVYLVDVPDQGDLNIVYPTNYMQYSIDEGEKLAWKAKKVLDVMMVRSLKKYLTQGTNVLDVGCAQGRLLDAIKSSYSKIGALEGVEISEKAADTCRKKGYTVTVGTFESIEPKSNFYNVVFLDQVIEHLYSPRTAIKKINKALQLGGAIVLKTPTSDCIDFKFFKKRYWGGYHFPRHFNIFSRKSLSVLLVEAGFEVSSVKYLPQPAHWSQCFEFWLKERHMPRFLSAFFYKENPLSLAVFTVVEMLSKLLFGKTSNMEIIAVKIKD